VSHSLTATAELLVVLYIENFLSNQLVKEFKNWSALQFANRIIILSYIYEFVLFIGAPCRQQSVFCTFSKREGQKG